MRGDNENEDIEGLVEKVYDNYRRRPLTQKKDVTFEPRIYPHKGRHVGSLKRRNESSTTRNPLLFEIVENA